MKAYKVLIILFTTIYLTACQSTEIQFDLDELKSTVISAEIVNVHRDINLELEFDIVRTIAQDDLEVLLVEFSQITFTILIGNPQITDGEALKLNYIDRYEIISSNTILTYYLIDEKWHQDDLYSPPEFENFILKWKMK